MWGNIYWGQWQWGSAGTVTPPPDPSQTISASDAFSLTDAVTVSLRSVLVFGDQFNRLDAATCILVVYVEPINISTGDRFFLADGPNLAFSADDLLLKLGDRFWREDAAILAERLTVDKSDAFSLTDSFQFLAPYPLVAGDTFFYYWADSIQMALDQVINAGDAFAFLDAASALNIITAKLISTGDAFSFTDSIRLTGQQVLALGDKLSLSDDLIAQLHTRLVTGDALSLTDFIRIVRSDRGSVFGDILGLTDSVTISMSSPKTISVGDGLAMTDGVVINIRGTMANYLRRRLNDVSL